MKAWMALLLLVPLAACEREDRDYRSDQLVNETQEQIALTTISPGDNAPLQRPSGLATRYLSNAYHVNQGKKWYAAFNCNGCHANGGGDSGPPLMDDKWIYGGSIENIVSTIREGRPNGMPSWRGRLTDEQIWQLAAYIVSMSGRVRSDVAPGRNDDISPGPPETMRMPTPSVTAAVPKTAEMPQ